jgi:multiple sugar transport system ATP-binding protein
MAVIEYVEATCTYAGSDAPAVSALNLTINDGELMVLVGPSGSGKSTALRMLAGLEGVTGGRILLGSTDITHQAPKDRDIAMVFQNYALYPHMSVAENMAFSLKLRGIGKADRMARVVSAAQLLDLEPYLERRPRALSGGQRQRVAMGRAIVREPSVFLMDEPLSNLDAKLRVETRANIAALQRRLQTTTVYVTHDQVEAMTMGHRVAVLNEGVLQQVDSPRTLYDSPCNVFVAGFIGSPAMNLRRTGFDATSLLIGGEAIELSPEDLRTIHAADADSLTLGVRPESVFVNALGDGLPLKVTLVEELGADSYVYGELVGDTHEDRPFVVRHEGRSQPAIGEVVFVTTDPRAHHLFDRTTGLRL